MDERVDELIAQGHEPIETGVRAVWRTAGVITLVVIGCYLLVLGLMKWFTAFEGRPLANNASITDVNRDERGPLQQLRNQEQQLLSRYQWIDPAAGVARIPVDRAIEIISQSGLPAVLGGQPAAAAESRPSASPGDASTTAEGTEQ